MTVRPEKSVIKIFTFLIVDSDLKILTFFQKMDPLD